MATGNSQEVAYGFGQLGSVLVKTGTPVVPPKGMVIVAVQFIEANTISAIISESDRAGLPNFIDSTTAGNMNLSGFHKSDVANGTYAAGQNITLVTPNTKIQVGDPVLLTGNAANVNTGTGIVIDSETPAPNYEKYNNYVKVESINAAGTVVTLSHQVTPNAQALLFLDGANGAGGNAATGVTYPMGMIIYGRWISITPAASPVICYFGY